MSAADDWGSIDAHWRAANYLGAAQIYLRDNVLLREPLRPEHIKPRLLGHWGTVPGINFVYTHLNRLIRQRAASVMLVTGPGHGAPANLANLFLEGSLGEFDRGLGRDGPGLASLVRRFSWPGGAPSHLTPATPGTIHEGGELGYALATAFGAAFDHPDLVVACIVGDGEAETGPTATAWHGTKFLHPANDGAVLPIVHVNGYKISSETLFGAMTDDELTRLFEGYGYEVVLVDVREVSSAEAHRRMASAVDRAHDRILAVQAAGRADPRHVERPRWPVLILRSLKGWTGIHELDGKPVEGSFRAHQVPAKDVRKDPEQLAALERWLRSYRPDELFDAQGAPVEQVLRACPTGEARMGMNPYAHGGERRQELDLPDAQAYGIAVDTPGGPAQADTERLGEYLRDIIRRNPRCFRIVCPDEMTSNRLGAVFEGTTRQFVWPTDPRDESIRTAGRVLEVLSEHTCQAWLQGYLLTGRHGLFPCYEAFAGIVDSMMSQYAKFLKQAAEVPWRKPVSSFTYLLSSEGWRQDHNGYSHQNPGFLNVLLTKKAAHARIYLPPDTNCLLSTIAHCFTSTDKINLVIASKQRMPQWLSPAEAEAHCVAGASVWRWAGQDGDDHPDVVLAASGTYPTAEVMAAAKLLRDGVPGLKLRVVNVTDLLVIEPESSHPHGLTDEIFGQLFPLDRPVIYNFHGYPSALKQLLFDRPRSSRFVLNGYLEEGTTTTPFDLLRRNRIDRFHVAMQALAAAAPHSPAAAARLDTFTAAMRQRIDDISAHLLAHGEDPHDLWHAEAFAGVAHLDGPRLVPVDVPAPRSTRPGRQEAP